MSAGGPRLGKLAGLKREGDDDDPQAKQRRPANKGGIKVCVLNAHCLLIFREVAAASSLTCCCCRRFDVLSAAAHPSHSNKEGRQSRGPRIENYAVCVVVKRVHSDGVAVTQCGATTHTCSRLYASLHRFTPASKAGALDTLFRGRVDCGFIAFLAASGL